MTGTVYDDVAKLIVDQLVQLVDEDVGTKEWKWAEKCLTMLNLQYVCKSDQAERMALMCGSPTRKAYQPGMRRQSSQASEASSLDADASAAFSRRSSVSQGGASSHSNYLWLCAIRDSLFKHLQLENVSMKNISQELECSSPCSPLINSPSSSPLKSQSSTSTADIASPTWCNRDQVIDLHRGQVEMICRVKFRGMHSGPFIYWLKQNLPAGFYSSQWPIILYSVFPHALVHFCEYRSLFPFFIDDDIEVLESCIDKASPYRQLSKYGIFTSEYMSAWCRHFMRQLHADSGTLSSVSDSFRRTCSSCLSRDSKMDEYLSASRLGRRQLSSPAMHLGSQYAVETDFRSNFYFSWSFAAIRVGLPCGSPHLISNHGKKRQSYDSLGIDCKQKVDYEGQLLTHIVLSKLSSSILQKYFASNAPGTQVGTMASVVALNILSYRQQQSMNLLRSHYDRLSMAEK